MVNEIYYNFCEDPIYKVSDFRFQPVSFREICLESIRTFPQNQTVGPNFLISKFCILGTKVASAS